MVDNNSESSRIDSMTWRELADVAPIECEVLHEYEKERITRRYVKGELHVLPHELAYHFRHPGFIGGELFLLPSSMDIPVIKTFVFIRVPVERAYDVECYLERQRASKEQL